MEYQFEGVYVEGKRVRGRLSWKEDPRYVNQDYTSVYNGAFNDLEQFHGKGTLKNMFGVYEGNFVKGHKHGAGIFKSDNGTLYEGNYVND